MSKYFKPYPKNEEDPLYPEDIRHIRAEIEALYGKVKCSNKKLGELWRDFSDDVYDAYFLDANPMLILEFVRWLEAQN